ncbi:MAG: hypothetical protein Ct9H300mP1_33510 [Planctomycetaceae bacterium]|nr:MAG: hypothetical protein Ct9H300mP1_33510 [Planctomycetaceae bacterium]
MTVSSPSWDTHVNNFSKLRHLLPPLDQAFPALILDLKERGLLESTLVVWMTDFGRTPLINSAAAATTGPRPGRSVLPVRALPRQGDGKKTDARARGRSAKSITPKTSPRHLRETRDPPGHPARHRRRTTGAGLDGNVIPELMS